MSEIYFKPTAFQIIRKAQIMLSGQTIESKREGIRLVIPQRTLKHLVTFRRWDFEVMQNIHVNFHPNCALIMLE